MITSYYQIIITKNILHVLLLSSMKAFFCNFSSQKNKVYYRLEMAEICKLVSAFQTLAIVY